MPFFVDLVYIYDISHGGRVATRFFCIMHVTDLFTTRLHFPKGRLDRQSVSENELQQAHDEVDDGPMPQWSGLIWLPLLLFAVAFFVGLGYAVWISFF